MSNNASIFIFECNKGIDRCSQVHELLILELRDLFFNLSHLIESLEHNVASTKSEEIDKFSIIEGELDVCDSNSINLNVSCLLWLFSSQLLKLLG